MAGQQKGDFDCFVTTRFTDEGLESSHHSEGIRTTSSDKETDEFIDLIGTKTSSGEPISISNKDEVNIAFTGMNFQVSSLRNDKKKSFSDPKKKVQSHGDIDEFSELASRNQMEMMSLETSATFSNNPFPNKGTKDNWITVEPLDTTFDSASFAINNHDVTTKSEVKISTSDKFYTSTPAFLPGGAGSNLLPKQIASQDSSDISYILSDDRDEHDHASSQSDESRQDEDIAWVEQVAFARNPFSNAARVPSQKPSKERKVHDTAKSSNAQTLLVSSSKLNKKDVSAEGNKSADFETIESNSFVTEKAEKDNHATKTRNIGLQIIEGFGNNSFQREKASEATSTSKDQSRELVQRDGGESAKVANSDNGDFQEESEVSKAFAKNVFVTENMEEKKNAARPKDADNKVLNAFGDNPFHGEHGHQRISADSNQDGITEIVGDFKKFKTDNSGINETEKGVFETFETNPFSKPNFAIGYIPSRSEDTSDCSFLTSGSENNNAVEPAVDVMASLTKAGLSDPFGQNSVENISGGQSDEDSSKLSFTLSEDMDKCHNEVIEGQEVKTKPTIACTQNSSDPSTTTLFVDESTAKEMDIANVEETCDISFSLSVDNDDHANSSEMLRYMQYQSESMVKGSSAVTTSSCGESANSSLISFLTHSSLDPDDRFISPKKPQSLLTPSDETKERWRRALRPTPESLPTARGRIKVLQCSPPPKALRIPEFHDNEIKNRVWDAKGPDSVVVMYDSVRRLIGYPVEKVMYSSVQKQLAYPVDDAKFVAEQEDVIKLKPRPVIDAVPKIAIIDNKPLETLNRVAMQNEVQSLDFCEPRDAGQTTSEPLEDIIKKKAEVSESEMPKEIVDSQNESTIDSSGCSVKTTKAINKFMEKVFSKNMEASIAAGAKKDKNHDSPRGMEIMKPKEGTKVTTLEISNCVDTPESLGAHESFPKFSKNRSTTGKIHSELNIPADDVGHIRSPPMSPFSRRGRNQAQKIGSETNPLKSVVKIKDSSCKDEKVPVFALKSSQNTEDSRHSSPQVQTHSKHGKLKVQKNLLPSDAEHSSTTKKALILENVPTSMSTQKATANQRLKLNLSVGTNESDLAMNPRINSFSPLSRRQNKEKILHGSNLTDSSSKSLQKGNETATISNTEIDQPISFKSPIHDASSPSVKNMINYWEQSSPSSIVPLTPK